MRGGNATGSHFTAKAYAGESPGASVALFIVTRSVPETSELRTSPSPSPRPIPRGEGETVSRFRKFVCVRLNPARGVRLDNRKLPLAIILERFAHAQVDCATVFSPGDVDAEVYFVGFGYHVTNAEAAAR
jgi:hypothetical protein